MAPSGNKLIERIERNESFYRSTAEDGNADAMIKLGMLLQTRGQFTEAENWYRTSAAAGRAEAMLLLGLRLHRRGDHDGAKKQFYELLDATFHDRVAAADLRVEAYFQLGSVFRELGDLDEAKEWWGYAAQDGHPNAMFPLATLLWKRGDVAEAETWFRRAADSGDVEAMFELAVLLQERGEHEEAGEWFQRSARRSAGPFGGTRAATRSAVDPAPSCGTHRDEIAEFYVSFQPALHAYARRGASDVSDAADIVQDAMIRLLHGWERFRVLSRDELVAIAFASVRYSWLDRRREQRRGARHVVEMPVDYLTDLSDPTAVEGHEGLVAEETAQRVLRILPLRQREIMSRVIAGHTVAMIAEELEMNAATVRRLLQRARIRIADELDFRPHRPGGEPKQR